MYVDSHIDRKLRVDTTFSLEIHAEMLDLIQLCSTFDFVYH